MLRRADYTACYETASRLGSRHFILFVRNKADAAASWRVGMAVSKKIGCAVARNRVKRVLREFFRLHQALLPDGVDMVVVPKRHLRVKQLTVAMVRLEFLPLMGELERLARP